MLLGTRFPREDAIDNIDHEHARHVYWQDGARGTQIQQEDRFNDRFNVQMQRANRRTYVVTRLFNDGTRCREASRAGLLPDNNTNRRRLDRTGQDTYQY